MADSENTVDGTSAIDLADLLANIDTEMAEQAFIKANCADLYSNLIHNIDTFVTDEGLAGVLKGLSILAVGAIGNMALIVSKLEANGLSPDGIHPNDLSA
jgi:hypothetical protein